MLYRIPTCTQTISPGKNSYVPPGTCDTFYDRYLSFTVALVTAVLFGAVMLAHIAQAASYKKVRRTRYSGLGEMLWLFSRLVDFAESLKTLTRQASRCLGLLLGPDHGRSWEPGSFATRTSSTRHQQNVALISVSQILVLIAPLCSLSTP